MATTLCTLPITSVPATNDQHDQLLARIVELQREVKERQNRLSQDNAPDQQRIDARTTEAAADIGPRQDEIKRLMALSYGFAREVLPASSGEGPRHREQAAGTFKLHRSGKPEVIIGDPAALIAELRSKRLLNLFTVVKRVISKEALIAHRATAAKLRNVQFVNNETYSFKSSNGENKYDTAELETMLRLPDQAAS